MVRRKNLGRGGPYFLQAYPHPGETGTPAPLTTSLANFVKFQHYPYLNSKKPKVPKENCGMAGSRSKDMGVAKWRKVCYMGGRLEGL
jgi:hypothetical protein